MKTDTTQALTIFTEPFCEPSPAYSFHVTRTVMPATIGGLDTYACYVWPDTPVAQVVAQLKTSPQSPGVIFEPAPQSYGMVSRGKCMELLSRPYGNALFLQRSVLNLYEELAMRPTVLPAEMRINEAVNIALARPLDQRYEPLLVDFADGQLRLLDLHTLLLAQAKTLENVNRLIAQQMEIGRALSSTLDLEVVLHLILRHIDDMVPYDRAGILLEQDGVLKFAATRGFPDDAVVQHFALSVSHSPIYRQICAERHPLTFSDVSQRLDWESIPGLPVARSWLGVPLLHAQGVLGMLSLTRTVIHDFIAEEVDLAQSFARQAAVALQNARLYAETKAFNQVLEQRVQERTQELQLAYDQLARIDRAKSDFIAVTSHELRTPLTVIKCYAQMLQPYVQTMDNLAHLSDGLTKGVERMHDIVNNMLEVAKIDQEILSLYYTRTNLAYLVRTVQEKFAASLAERHLTLQIADLTALPIIQADSDTLLKVFYQLVANAIKYTPDRGRITINGQYWPAAESALGEESVQITIADTGIGIDPSYHDLIFTKFYRMDNISHHSSSRTNFKGGGPGLGLAIVRGLVNAHRGKVWVESPGCDEHTLPGSRFHVLLPVK